MSDALLHSCAVYLYVYDPQTRAYTQQSDAAVGCALLAGASETDAIAPTAVTTSPFKLLFYNAQKQPLLQLAVSAAAPACTPQQDNYVTLLDDSTQTFYSLRFKDASGVAAFLSAVAFAKAQVLATTDTSTTASAVLVDDLALGKTEGSKSSKTSNAAGIVPGDTAGVALTVWTGERRHDASSSFFTANPLDIATQPAVPRASDLERVRLVDSSDSTDSTDDRLMHALATQALAGMHKHGKRLVTVVTPERWTIAVVELVRVKSANRASATASPAATTADPSTSYLAGDTNNNVTTTEPATTAVHDELVQRMATLSRAGSKGSGLIASLSARLAGDNSTDSSSRSASRQTSFTAHSPAGTNAQPFVPVLPPSVVGDKQPFAAGSNGNSDASSSSSPPSHAPSFTAKVFAPLQDAASAATATVSTSSSSSTVSTDMAQLMQEQSDLARLREQLEESKRQLQNSSNDTGATDTYKRSSALPAANANDVGSNWRGASALPPPSSFSMPPASSGFGSSNASQSRWEPPSSSALVPSAFQPNASSSSYQPPALASSYQPPALASSFLSSYQPPASLSSYQPPSSLSLVPSPLGPTSTSNSFEVESGLLRLQRSSTSIETTLQDLDAKVDRLLNAQHSRSKFATPTLSSASTLSASASSVSATAQSSALLLKGLEKALTQRDELQTQTRELIDARDELAAAVDEQAQQLDALQRENRKLLEQRQSPQSALQIDALRRDLHSAEAQLANAQQQTRAFEADNQTLRRELAARDEQLVRERAARADDARQHSNALQQQRDALQQQRDKSMQLDRAAVEEMAAERTAQYTRECEALTVQLQAAKDVQAAQATQLQDAQLQLQTLVRETQQHRKERDQVNAHCAELEDRLAAMQHALVDAETQMQQMQQMQQSQQTHDLGELQSLLKAFMNDLYFHCQDAFDDESEFTGREVVLAVRKLLKQDTVDVLQRVEAFWQQRDGDGEGSEA